MLQNTILTLLVAYLCVLGHERPRNSPPPPAGAIPRTAPIDNSGSGPATGPPPTANIPERAAGSNSTGTTPAVVPNSSDSMVIADSVPFPAIVADYKDSIYTFYINKLITLSIPAQMNLDRPELAIDGNPQNFLFNNTISNCIVFPLNSETGTISVKINDACLFPVTVVSRDYPVYSIEQKSFSIKADIFGAPGFNPGALDTPIPLTETTHAINKMLHEFEINYQNQSSLDSPMLLSIYCPFFRKPLNKIFAFSISATTRNRQVEVVVDKYDTLLNSPQSIVIPFQGDGRLVLPQLASDTIFSFSATNDNYIRVDAQIGNEVVNDIQSGFVFEKDTSPVLIFRNAALQSNTVFVSAFVKPPSNHVGVILGVIFGVLGFIIILAAIFFLVRRSRQKKQFAQSPPDASPQETFKAKDVNDSRQYSRMDSENRYMTSPGGAQPNFADKMQENRIIIQNSITEPSDTLPIDEPEQNQKRFVLNKNL